MRSVVTMVTVVSLVTMVSLLAVAPRQGVKLSLGPVVDTLEQG